MDAFALAAKLTLDSSGFESDLGKSENTFKSFGSSLKNGFKNAAKVAAVGIGAAAMAVGKFAKDSIEAGKQFDATMSQVAAISGATGKEFDSLRAKAQEMGAKTKFSASESAKAFTYMAMAGWKTGDMLDGIEGLMNLAAASGESLAITSDIVTDALTAFGLSASDSGHFADVLAAASSNANTNVSMMGETFKYAAPLAGSLGFSIEDTALAIGLMANAGIKASQAGTSLRMIMTQTSQDFIVAGKNIGEYTVKTQNADGTMRSLRDILSDSRQAFSQLSEAEKVAAAESIAGKNAMSGWLALMNASDEDFDKLSSAIDNCAGSAEQMAAIMQDNLQGDLIIFKSALEGAQIALSDQLTPALRDFVQFGTKSVAELTDAFKKDGLNGAMEALGNIIAQGASKLIEGLPSFVDAGIKLIGGVATGLINNLPVIVEAGRKILGAIGEGIGNVYEWAKTTFSSAVTAIGEIDWAQAGHNILDTIGSSLAGIADWFKEKFTAATEGIKAVDWAQAGKDALQIIGTAFATIGSWFQEQFMPGPDGIAQVDWIGAGNAILDFIGQAFTSIGEFFGGIFEAGKTAIEQINWAEVGEKIREAVKTKLNEIIENAKTIFTDAKNAISTIDWVQLGTTIREHVESAIKAISSWFTDLFSGMITDAGSLDWTGLGNSIHELLQAGLSAIDGLLTGLFGDEWTQVKNDATEAWNTISTAFSDAYKAISDVWESMSVFFTDTIPGVWNQLSETASQVWNDIKGFITGAIDGAKTTLETTWANIVLAASVVWQFLKTTAESVWNAIKGFIEDPIGAAKDTLETAWGAIQSKAEEVWNAISASAQDIWNNIKSFIEDPIGTVKDNLSRLWSGIQLGASQAWNKIKSTVDSVIGTIKGVVDGFIGLVQSAIDTVAGWLGFNGKSVNITTHHVTYEETVYTAQKEASDAVDKAHSDGKPLTGTAAMLEYQLTHHARSMFGGSILRGATMFGWDAQGRPQIGGGEGPEAVVGVNSLNQQIRDAVRDGLSGIVGSIAQAIGGRNEQPIYVVLDTGELVGAIGGKMDAELGKIGDWKGGGRA